MAEQNYAWIEAALADCPTAAFQQTLRNQLRRSRLMRVATGQRGLGYHTVMPNIVVRDAEAFVHFAKQVFGAVENFKITNIDEAGNSYYELTLGDSVVLCSGGGPGFDGPEMPVMLHTYVPDADEVYRRAMDVGAESIEAPSDKPYGERNGGVKDPAGNQWFMATRLGNATQPPGFRTVVPYLIRPDAIGLMDFLRRAFDARVEGVMKGPDGKVMHALAFLGDSVIEVGEADRPASAFLLNVPDTDAVYEQALAAGASPVLTPRSEHWGVRMAGVKDAWGNSWTISTELNK